MVIKLIELGQAIMMHLEQDGNRDPGGNREQDEQVVTGSKMNRW